MSLNYVDGFGAWKSDGCFVRDVLDSSSITFNCARLAGYAVLLVRSCVLSGSDIYFRIEVGHQEQHHACKKNPD